MDLAKLEKMANQIAANVDYGPDKAKVVAMVTDHLKRFWTPAMRAAIIDAHRNNKVALSPLAAKAVEALPPPKVDAA